MQNLTTMYCVSRKIVVMKMILHCNSGIEKQLFLSTTLTQRPGLLIWSRNCLDDASHVALSLIWCHRGIMAKMSGSNQKMIRSPTSRPIYALMRHTCLYVLCMACVSRQIVTIFLSFLQLPSIPLLPPKILSRIKFCPVYLDICLFGESLCTDKHFLPTFSVTLPDY